VLYGGYLLIPALKCGVTMIPCTTRFSLTHRFIGGIHRPSIITHHPFQRIIIIYMSRIIAKSRQTFRKSTIILIATICFVGQLIADTPQTIVVKKDGTGDFTSIQSAIDASIDGDTVLVYPGTYDGNIIINGKNIVVGSLFMTTLDTSYISQTIIDGNQNMRCMTISQKGCIVEGFTISKGYANGSGGNDRYGGGILITTGTGKVFLNNLVVSRNYADYGGGGVAVCGMETSLNRCVISCNSTNINTPEVTYAGGVYSGSFTHIINSLLINNKGRGSSEITHSYETALDIINSTIVSNVGESISIISTINGHIIIVNSIIQNYGGLQNPLVNIQGGTISVYYSCINFNSSNETNIRQNPLFNDFQNNDYSLINYSPCIGTGIDSIEIDGTRYYKPTTDIDGNPRPNPPGSRPDIGAYENPRSAPLSPDTPSNLSVTSGNTQLTLSWTASTAPNVDRYYIYRSTTQGFAPSGVADTVASVDASQSSFTDTNLTNGTSYYYRVSAVDGLGNEGVYSNEASGTPKPQLLTVKKDGTSDFTSIQSAIDASTDDDTVLVYPGTYVENINWDKNNIIVGSLFITTGDTSYITQTIIDGNHSESVFKITAMGTSDKRKLIGLSIINGYASLGGGIFCQSSQPVLERLKIFNNSAFNFGAGIFCQNANPIVVNSRIYNNISDSWGSGISCDNYSSPKIINSIIYRNDGLPISCNNHSNLQIINSIIVEHKWTGTTFYVSAMSKPILINSVLWNSLSSNEISENQGGIVTARYCNILGGWEGEGNVNFYPSFIDTLCNNYHLLDYSPCIGTGIDSIEIDGTWYYAPTTDIDGNPRPNPAGSRPDIGAYESSLGVQPAVISFSQDTLEFESVGVGNTDTLELIIYNTSLASDLTISDIQSSNSVFTVSQSNLTIPADDSAIVEVYFNPDNFVTYFDSLTIISNAANEPSAKVYLSAEGKAIVAHSPTQNALNVPKDANITVTLGIDINPSTINENTFVVHASQTGLHTGTYGYNSGTKTVTFNPERDFAVGEIVTVVLTTGIKTVDNNPLINPYEWTFTIKVDGGSAVFKPKTDYTTGSDPYSVFSADLDSDGDLDLVAANFNSSSVSVLINNGYGIFGVRTDYSTGSNPYSVFSVDLDSDGDLDLVVANFNSSSISVLKNNGNGTFKTKVDYATGSYPRSVFSSDFDSDGDLDLAVANYGSNSVSVLLNIGDGTFNAKTDYTTGSIPYSIFSSDFDSDGDLDLAVTNSASNNVSILLNNGDGIFGSRTDYTTGLDPFSVFSSDFDLDGNPDLAVANGSSSSLSILLNKGDGTFGTKTDYAAGANSYSVFSSDLDSDGDQDLAVANGSLTSLSVLLNKGDGTFGTKTDYTTGSCPRSIFSSDLDSDGDLDLVVANTSSNSVSILLNRNKTADVSLSTNSLNFGSVKLDSNKNLQLTIYNDGVDSTLKITNITSSNPVFVPDQASGSVLPGDSLIVTVAFSPTAIGAFNGSLTITCNDPDNPNVYVSLTGLCGSYISGVITENTTWDRAHSPYIIYGNTAIDAGVTLTVEAGVEVRFNGLYDFNVYGNLIVNGALGDTVLFTSVADPAPGIWKEFNFSSGSSGSFDYCKLQASTDGIYASSVASLVIRHSLIEKNKNFGIFLSSTNSVIDNSIIKTSGTGMYSSSSSSQISNCKFQNNSTGVSFSSGLGRISGCTVSNNNVGFSGSSSSPQVDSCIVSNNTSHGIYFTSSTCSPTITNSIIANNGSYGIYYDYGYGQIKISNNQISDNSNWGVCISGASSGTEVKNNSIRNNKSGGIISYTYTNIANNTISDNLGDGIYAGSSSIAIKYNTINNNTGDGVETNSDIVIDQNKIYSNGENGINAFSNPIITYCDIYRNCDDGIETSGLPTVNYNNFADNTGYNIRATAEPTGIINAENNYWGTAIENEIKDKIWDFYDTGGSVAKVDYSPFFTEKIELLPVTGFTAQTLSGGKVKLRWDVHTFAHNYNLYYDNQTGIIDTLSAWVALDSTHLEYLATLADGYYKFGIKAEASDGRKSTLTICEAIADGTPPIMLSASGVTGDTLITVTFDEGLEFNSSWNIYNWFLSGGLNLNRISGDYDYSNTIAYWNFDESSGNIVYDLSGNENYGNINGAIRVSGKYQKSLSFDGIDDYMDANNYKFETATNTFTMCLWVYPLNTRLSTSESSSGTSGMSNQRYAIAPEHGQNLYGYGHAGSGISVGTNGISVFEHSSYYLTSTLVYDTDIVGWNHIVIVYNNKKPRLYLNGKFVKEGLTSEYVVHPSSLLGNLFTYGPFEGMIDEVIIYDRALSDIEISTLYHAASLNSNVKLFLSHGQKLPYPNNQITVTCNNIRDLYGNQANEQSFSFYPEDGNVNPRIVLTDIFGEQSEDVAICYQISDPENDVISLIPEYSVNDGQTWQAATVSSSTTGISSTKYSGKLIWNSATDLPHQEYFSVKFKVTPKDADPYNLGTPGITNVFALDNNHFQSITVSLSKTLEEYTDSVKISYTLVDTTDDILDLWSYYSTGVDWHNATVIGAATNLDACKYMGELIWDSRHDLSGVDSKNVRFKIIPSDRWTGGTADSTAIFHLDNNELPIVALEDLTGEQTGNVALHGILFDTEHDSLNIRLYYSTDNGNSWAKATVSGNTIGITDYNLVLGWDSKSDLPGVDLTTIKLKLVPMDNDTGIVDTTASFHLDNNYLPAISITPFSGEQKGDIKIPYLLADAENDTLSILCEYYDNSAETWIPATVTGDTSGIDYDHYSSNVIWNTLIDLPTAAQYVLFRITPMDNDSGLKDTTEILLDNLGVPSIVIKTIIDTEVSGDISFEYSIADDEGDIIAIRPEYSINSGQIWSLATVSGDTTGIDSSHYSGSLVWRSDIDLPGMDLFKVRFRITPRDNRIGVPDQTEDFHLDNNETPMIVLNELTGFQSGDVSINYTLADHESDTLRIYAQYYIDSTYTFVKATIVGDTAGIDRSRYSGNLIWESLTDLPNYADTVLFTLTVMDNDTGIVDTIWILLDNIVPSITLQDLEGEQSGDVTIKYRISNDSLGSTSLNSEYSIDSGKNWFSTKSIIGDTTGIDSSHYSGSLVWRSDIDLPGVDLFKVRFRITPRDNHIGVPDQTEDFHLDNNETPAIAISEIPDLVTGNIQINYTLSDPENDTLAILVEYFGSGSAAFKPATITGDTSGISKNHYSSGVIWQSDKDCPNFAGNIQFRITPHDNDIGLSDTTTIIVDNVIPVISLAEISGEQNGDVLLHYQITNDTLSQVSLHYEYRTENSNYWLFATISGDTSIIGSDHYTGTNTWHSTNDLAGLDLFNTQVRILPYDILNGIMDSTNIFHLDNNHIPVIPDVFAPVDEVTNDVVLQYIAYDDEKDTLDYIFQYSVDSGENWQDASYNCQYQHLPPENDTLSVTWLTAEDIPNLDLSSVKFRLIPVDNDTGLVGESGIFHVDNETGPIVVDKFPKVFALWQDTIQINFDRDININSLSENITVTGTRSNNITFATDYNNLDQELFLIPESPFKARESIQVKLSTGIRDEFGSGLDGDQDGDPEGSPTDDYTWDFVIPYLGDYDNSDTVDIKDLIIFAEKWRQTDQDFLYEIGPAIGEPPYFELQPDSLIDFEDFVTLARMWNYSIGLSKLSAMFATKSEQDPEKISALTESSINAKKILKEEVALKNSGKAKPFKEQDNKPIKNSNISANKNQKENIPKIAGPTINLVPKISSDPWQNSKNGSFEVEVNVSQQSLDLSGSQLVFQYNQDLLRFDGFKTADSKDQAVEKSLTKAVTTEKLQNIAGLSVGSDKLVFQHNEANIVLLDIIRMSQIAGLIDGQSNLILLQFSVINKGVSDIKFCYSAYGNKAVLLSSGKDAVTIDSKLLIPETFAIYQNYPNPFNTYTMLKYQLPTESDVNIVIYNLLGEVVVKLVNTHQFPGYYQIQWNGQNSTGIPVASGLYIYQIIASSSKKNFIRSKKMLLVK